MLDDFCCDKESNGTFIRCCFMWFLGKFFCRSGLGFKKSYVV